jgi:uncharacterized protein YndB with AHSA1/START domain
MELIVKTQIQVSASPRQVFEAIVDPEQMSKYFISSGNRRMEENTMVNWEWADYNAEAAVEVKKITEDTFISFEWAASNVKTKVEISLKEISEGVTEIRITEDGWNKDDKGIARLAEQTQGWMHMLMCLKAYLEYGINLRALVKRNVVSG